MIGALVFLLCFPARALDAVEMPQSDPNDCERSLFIEYGKPIPFELAGPNGVAKCSAIVEPPASFAYLLAVETRSETADRLYALDVSMLETERDWFRSELEQQRDRPWWQTPEAQRWFGRLEMLAVVGIVAGSMGAAYNLSK